MKALEIINCAEIFLNHQETTENLCAEGLNLIFFFRLNQCAEKLAEHMDIGSNQLNEIFVF
jgi:hypothetical protein